MVVCRLLLLIVVGSFVFWLVVVGCSWLSFDRGYLIFGFACLLFVVIVAGDCG